MANPVNEPLPLSGDYYVDATTSGYFWKTNNKIITWSISDGFGNGTWENPDYAIENISAVFDLISQYIDLTFEYVGQFSDPRTAYVNLSDINLFWDASDPQWSAAGFFPDANLDLSADGFPGLAGDVVFNINNEVRALTDYETGSDFWELLLHELGHVLGLKHPHDDGGSGRPTYLDLAIQEYKNAWSTVMSYDFETPSNAITPMLMDVIGLQFLYGANEETNQNDDSHRLTTTYSYQTIWDSSGVDTIVVDDSPHEWRIQLPVRDDSIGALSPRIGYANLKWDESPYHTFYGLLGDIENAIGSNYDDFIWGNELNNHLNGMAGSDYLDGGAGLDVAEFEWDHSQYNIIILDDLVTVSRTVYDDPEGARELGASTDEYNHLENIERLAFDDYYLGLDIEGVAGQTYRLYQAAFNRVPDKAGLGYWIHTMDSGMGLIEVANRFLDSPEFQSLYGASPTHEEFLSALYHNILDREADAAGYEWWLDRLYHDPDKSWGKVLADFSESPENQLNVAGEIENGVLYELWLG